MSATGQEAAPEVPRGHTTPTRPASPAHAPIWTRTFLLLGAAQILIYGQEGLLTPVLPLYMASLGASEVVVGLVLAAFSITSFITRPVLGYWADRWSMRGVLLAGTSLLGAGASALLLTPSVWLLPFVNSLRGTAWAAANTGSNTWLAHIAPPRRRGEAASYFNLFQSGPYFLAPLAGLWLLGQGGSTAYSVVFAIAAAGAVGATLLTALVPRHAANVAAEIPAAPGPAIPPTRWARFFDPSVLLAAVLTALNLLSAPATQAFVPLYLRSLGVGVESVTWYFAVTGVGSLLARAMLGRIGDYIGRAPATVIGYGASIVGLGLFAVAQDLAQVIAGGVVYLLGSAVITPTMMALAMDRADPRRRGTAMASYSMAFQAGVGTGAALWGLLADVGGYRVMYAGATASAMFGLLVAVFAWSNLARRQSSPAE